MKSNDYLFSYTIFTTKLNVIKDIRFTPREIDVISCLMHMRGSSKISSLLSISPNTVLSHIRNIMLKIRCNSREGIIDFVEKSSAFPLINKHYTQLVLYVSFEKTVKQIATIKKKEKQVYLLFYGQKQQNNITLVQQLMKHLKQAGINNIIKNITNEIQEIETNKNNKVVKIIMLTDRRTVSREFHKHNIIDLNEHPIYYFLVFEILKKVFYPMDITDYFQDFYEQYKGMRKALELIFYSAPSNKERKANKFSKKIQSYHSRN